MRAWISILVALAACGGERLTDVVGPEVRFSLLVDERGVRVLEADDLPVVAEDPPDPWVLLDFDRSLDELALERDEDGLLVRAASDAIAEEVWPLPTPIRGRRFDASSAALVPLDASALTAQTEAIGVPVPRCGALVRGVNTRLPVPDPEPNFESIASIGEVAIVTTEGSPARRTFPEVHLVRDGESTLLRMEPALDMRTRVFAFEDLGRFVLVTTSMTRLRTYRVEMDGRMQLTLEVASSTVGFTRTIRQPGGSTMYARDAKAERVFRLDLATGQWTLLPLTPSNLLDVRCDAFEAKQTFMFDSPSTALVGFPMRPLHRFSDTSAGLEPIDAGALLGVPCQSVFMRFEGGAEMIVAIVTTPAGASLAQRVAWREGERAAWIQEPYAIQLQDVVMRSDRVVAIDAIYDDLVRLERDPRRPEQRPRVCATMGLGQVRALSFDGDGGFLVSQDVPSSPLDIVRFTVEP